MLIRHVFTARVDLQYSYTHQAAHCYLGLELHLDFPQYQDGVAGESEVGHRGDDYSQISKLDSRPKYSKERRSNYWLEK